MKRLNLGRKTKAASHSAGIVYLGLRHRGHFNGRIFEFSYHEWSRLLGLQGASIGPAMQGLHSLGLFSTYLPYMRSGKNYITIRVDRKKLDRVEKFIFASERQREYINNIVTARINRNKIDAE